MIRVLDGAYGSADGLGRLEMGEKMSIKKNSKLISWLRRSRAEEGQAMVMVAFSLVVILGFAAFAIDIGNIAVQKSDLQNAADAAALAGVVEMPSSTNAETVAVNYAITNGMAVQKNKVALNGELVSATAIGPKQLKVECSREVKYYFAGVLGFKSKVVTAVAVAEKKPQWAGEALPFINLDDDYKLNPKIVAWEKTGPGDFESLWPGNNPPSEYEMFNKDDHSKFYFTIDYLDGITTTKGTVATIKQEVGWVRDQSKHVYIFSLSSAAINSGRYNRALSNKEVIPLSDLVLLEVSITKYNEKTGKTLELTCIKEYDIKNGVVPSEFLNGGTNKSAKLVE